MWKYGICWSNSEYHQILFSQLQHSMWCYEVWKKFTNIYQVNFCHTIWYHIPVVLLNVTGVRSSNLRYNTLWTEHVNRMSSDTIPKEISEYQSKQKKQAWKDLWNEGRILFCNMNMCEGLNRTNTGKNDNGDVQNNEITFKLGLIWKGLIKRLEKRHLRNCSLTCSSLLETIQNNKWNHSAL
jgi:hypothetical protein